MTKPFSPFGSRASADWFRITPRAALADQPAEADVYIYEQIGYDWWDGTGITAKSFAEQIGALDVQTIRLHLNSPGGLAYDGITIMNALRDHPARIEVTVDGLAASAASIIAMAGDHVTMNRGSQLMIHDASTIAWGNAAEMERTIEQLNKLSDSLADIYAARAGGTREEWRTAMQAETWYTAEEAAAAGLADDWADSADEEALAAVARFDLTAFAYAGRVNAPAPSIDHHEPPVSSEPGSTIRKENVVAYDDFKAGIAKRLGITDADASDETVTAALDQALAEQADTPTAALPEGVTVIDSTVLADLQAQAAQGAAARAEQTRTRREGILDSALADGRITPASRGHFETLLASNEEQTTQLLESMPKNTALPVVEIGNQVVSDEDDANYEAIYGQKTEG